MKKKPKGYSGWRQNDEAKGMKVGGKLPMVTNTAGAKRFLSLRLTA